MRRREFVWLLGGAAAWPLAAPAQQASKLYRIGYLSLGSVVAEALRYNAIRAELAALARRRQIRPAYGVGRIAGRSEGRHHRHSYDPGSFGRQTRDDDNTHRLCIGRRCRGYGSGIQPRPARQQCGGNVVLPSRTCGETRGVAQGGVTGPGAGRCLVQSCKSGGPAGAGGHEGDRPDHSSWSCRSLRRAKRLIWKMASRQWRPSRWARS
jgi:hypothetical protein